MGLFRRKARKSNPVGRTDKTVGVTATGLPAGARSQVAGVSYRQAEIRAALAVATPDPPAGLDLWSEDADAIGWIVAVLVPLAEDHDPTAVGVFCAGAGQVGWIPARLSGGFREMLEEFVTHQGNESGIGICLAYVDRWGERMELLGVRLCCSWPDEVLDDLDQEPDYQYPDDES